MPIDLGALFRTVSSGAAAGLEGRDTRNQRRRTQSIEDEERERRARQDALLNQLTEARIGDLADQRQGRADERDRATDATEVGEAQLNERANYYQQQFPDHIPNGMLPQLAVEVGERLERNADLDAAADRTRANAAPKYRLTYSEELGRTVYENLNPATGRYEPEDTPARGPSGSEAIREQVISAARTMVEAARTAGELEDLDPAAAIMPLGAAAMRGVGNLPVVGGALRGLTDPAAQSQLSVHQQQFRQAADVFTHNYVATLPRSRVSPLLIEQIRDTFFPRAGQTDPAVLRQFRQKRERASQALLDALEGRATDLSGLPGMEGLRPSDLVPIGGSIDSRTPAPQPPPSGAPVNPFGTPRNR